VELEAALGFAREAGASVYLLTLTVPHKRWERCAKVLTGVRLAVRKFNSGGRSMKRLLERHGYIGQIRALEVTHGDNGWHPHLHLLLLLDGHPAPEELADLLRGYWRRACIKAGLEALPSDEHGLTVQDGSRASKYVGKWGIEHEMTKAHVKRGGRGGRTPWELLEAAALGDEEAGELWKEFALAFKGARQLFWSEGLKALCGVADLDDQAVVEQEEQPADPVLVAFDGLTWGLLRRHGRLSRVLDHAEEGGAAAVHRYVAKVRGQFLGRYGPPQTLEEAAA
jgi:hypothetical protein